MNPYSPSIVSVNSTDTTNTRDFLQQAVDTDALLVRKSALNGGFSDESKLVAPVEFLVTGNLSACTEVFQAHALPAVMMSLNRIALQPEQ
ncbi:MULTISPECIES: hypothetical protein [Enterobacteriaceae]|uniref:Uncharacterized protein n=1 Tax=Enterobacter wuhouensis TaxID=2529381 RepID=A0A4R0GAX5_9ENTR|nr:MULTISPECIES: hypothetical protein [Enterobacteriaceae]MCL9642079.1 hypothetical protein [Rahnella victoriana]HDX4251294.1 hypothetical protein [Klebsiella oxytoca]MDM6727452.1 hypothetical protein [Klebsiella grimontii]MDM7224104.1 hypothetical protein [Klebsiella grimontii]MDM7237467.1 hypothetical protein [Klebsiella grimontii]